MKIIKEVAKILEYNGIEVVAYEQGIFLTTYGDLFFYDAKYRFHEVRETNIPYKIYKKIPKNVNDLIVRYRDGVFLLRMEDIIRIPRLVGGIKVLPIREDSLVPLRSIVKEVLGGQKFVHLHLHSEYSLLDAVSKCSDYITTATRLGMEAMAITDHGNMSGHMDFYLRCKNSGIKPIFGIEAYFVNDATKHDQHHRKNNHIVLLAQNEDGYKNLLKLQKLSWSDENFYYRPRLDWRMLKKYNKGLLCLTACIKGLLSAPVTLNKPKLARKNAKKLLRIFGSRLYIELMLLNIVKDGVDYQQLVNEELVEIAEELGIPTVVTNDVHYCEKGMHKVQDMVVKIHTDTEMYSIACTDLWLKTYEELLEASMRNCPYLGKALIKDSLDISNEIASRCNYEIPTGENLFPHFNHKKHFLYKKWGRKLSKQAFFKKLVRVSAKKKKLWNIKEYRKRIKYEIDALIKTNSLDYVLIVDDLLRYMRNLGCLFNMRGSANGSLVCYLLGFSVVDPIKYNIMFERFISPGRILQGLQDIDIDLDFEAEYRDIAIRYLKEKYGEDRICNVGTFNRLQLKMAIKSLTRVEAEKLKKAIKETVDEDEKAEFTEELKKFSFQAINKITKAMAGFSREGEISGNEEVEKWYSENRDWFRKYVRPILGNAYTASIHPAGVAITPTAYDEWMPVRTQKDKSGVRVYTTQWENSHTYEEFLNERGIMILDVLGVNALSIISKTLKDVNRTYDTKYTLDNIPRDDKEVYRTLAEGENLGYFQLGKPSLKGLLRDLRPDSLDDLIFLSAADRPGALAAQAHVHYINRKHGKEDVKYDHDSLKSVLEHTYGVIVYSEHIMKTATDFADMTIVEAEELRKIMKAKDPRKFAEYKVRFMEGAKRKWGDDIEEVAKMIWEKFRASATYLFPLGHSTAYAIYGNATQWLKIHYPVEFFKNYLSYASDKDYPAIMAVARKNYGVRFINPSVNFSKANFSIRKGKIVWSLCSIKGVGLKAASDIESKQPFSSFEDFFERVTKRVCNVKIVTALIVAGAFRAFGDMGTLIEKYYKLKKQQVPEKYDDLTDVDWQIERSKVVSYSILSLRDIFRDKVKRIDTYSAFIKAPKGRRIVILGKVSKKHEMMTRKGDDMWILVLEDFGEQYSVVFWSDFLKTLKNKKTKIVVGSIIVVSGYKSKNPRDEHQLALGREDGCYVKILK